MIKKKEGSKEGREEIASREQYTFALEKKKKKETFEKHLMPPKFYF